MRRLLVILTMLALAGLFPAGAAARHWRAPCLGSGHGGPVCHFWSARVVSINDGDTIGVRVGGHGPVREVRFIGVQAMELHRYNPKHWTGECNAVEAAKRVRRLVHESHMRVRLSAQHAGKRFGTRIGRWIAVRLHGRWRDLGAIELAEGHTLWVSNETETALNARYNRIAQRAEQKHIGLWDPTHCGAGPQQDLPLRMWVEWNPHGVDQADPNGEWVKIQNLSPSEPLSLDHWWMRDSGLRRYSFPPGTSVRPGATLTVHVGAGQSAGDTLYWGLSAPVFQNIGDGAYLFDPQGDLRASMIYPCVVACSDPYQGALRVSAQIKGHQYIQVQNVSSQPVNLYGYQLNAPGWPYDFTPNSVLQPGQTLRVDLDGATAQDSQLDRHWGTPYPFLHPRGDVVRVMTFSEITVACDAWASMSC